MVRKTKRRSADHETIHVLVPGREMLSSHHCSALASLFFYALHLAVFFVSKFLQTTWWFLNGTASHLRNIKKGKDYEHSAQLLRIHHRSLPQPCIIHKQRHFITSHVKFVHPEYVLQENVILMTVTEDEAIFGVVPHDENVFDTVKTSFLYDAIFKHSQYLLVMPVTSMIKLAGKVGRPNAKVIWLHSTGRCGSTAMAQVFNNLPESMALSEPFGLLSIIHSFKGRHFGEGTEWKKSRSFVELYTSAVCMILKPIRTPAKVILVKSPPMMSLVDAELLHEHFPEFIQAFLYRNGSDQIYSLYKSLVSLNPVADLTRYGASVLNLHKLSPDFLPVGITYTACEDREMIQWLMDPAQLLKITCFHEYSLSWAWLCGRYKKLISSIDWKDRIVAFRFEHLKSDRQSYLKGFFHYVGIEMTDELMSLTLEALDQDSQQGSSVNRLAVSQRKVVVSQQMIDEVNKYFHYFDVPLWGELMELPNTCNMRAEGKRV